MKTKLLFKLALCAVVPLLCSCASTSLEKTWKAPEARGPLGKVAVLAIEDDGLVRQAFENFFAVRLATNGVRASTTFQLFTLAELKQDKRAAVEHFEASGVETVLILRLVDKSTSYREVQPGPEVYAATISDFDTMGWYDYYNVSFMRMSTSYGSFKDRVLLESSLYNLKTERRTWSGLTRTVVGEDMDRLAEIGVIAEKIVAAMRQDGMIQ